MIVPEERHLVVSWPFVILLSLRHFRWLRHRIHRQRRISVSSAVAVEARDAESPGLLVGDGNVHTGPLTHHRQKTVREAIPNMGVVYKLPRIFKAACIACVHGSIAPQLNSRENTS